MVLEVLQADFDAFLAYYNYEQTSLGTLVLRQDAHAGVPGSRARVWDRGQLPTRT